MCEREKIANVVVNQSETQITISNSIATDQRIGFGEQGCFQRGRVQVPLPLKW